MTTHAPPEQGSRDQLLAALLAPQAGALPALEPAVPAPTSAPTRHRSRRASKGALGTGLAYVAALGIGTALWVLDGFYTLVALKALGFPIVAVVDWPWLLSSAALFVWAIPLGVEAIEQIFLGERGWQLLLFIGVAGLNTLATGYGLWETLEGRTAFLSANSPALWGIAAVGGCVLSFGPGRLVLAAVKALYNLVR